MFFEAGQLDVGVGFVERRRLQRLRRFVAAAAGRSAAAEALLGVAAAGGARGR